MKIAFDKLHLPPFAQNKIKKIHWILASHAFSAILFFIFLGMLWGVFLFYQYVILAQSKNHQVAGGTARFEYNTYQQVLKQWQAREKVFQEFKEIRPKNPFTAAP